MWRWRLVSLLRQIRECFDLYCPVDRARDSLRHFAVNVFDKWVFGTEKVSKNRRFWGTSCKQWTKRERTLCGEENQPQCVAEHLSPNTATSSKLTYVNFSANYMAFLHTNNLRLFFYLDCKKAVILHLRKLSSIIHSFPFAVNFKSSRSYRP